MRAFRAPHSVRIIRLKLGWAGGHPTPPRLETKQRSEELLKYVQKWPCDSASHTRPLNRELERLQEGGGACHGTPPTARTPPGARELDWALGIWVAGPAGGGFPGALQQLDSATPSRTRRRRRNQSGPLPTRAAPDPKARVDVAPDHEDNAREPEIGAERQGDKEQKPESSRIMTFRPENRTGGE
ncbi:hypothetical protein NDU88_005830 [Pleurodeles waltl]|uniref:Uncharacterized protein n=1 Tax=Pleurodeles waltl TaxID=8319 RepID=A0AAV7WYZ4_PLEWA|nr:hypothetical protein NDU88_005830 [Pleurodeles waltl]